MDIDDILSQASHNVKKNHKKIKEAEEELQKERNRKIAALKRQKQLEREELAKKKPPPPPPKQVLKKMRWIKNQILVQNPQEDRRQA